MSEYFPSRRARRTVVKVKVKDREQGERFKEMLEREHPGAEGKISVSEEGEFD